MKKLLFILLNLLIINNLSTQNRFGGGVILGFNAAQMDGDRAAGYNKVGLNTGLRGTVRLNDEGKWLLSTELLFSQRGARSVERDYFITNWKATLNYIEIPVRWAFFPRSSCRPRSPRPIGRAERGPRSPVSRQSRCRC